VNVVQTAALYVDLLATSIVVGATVWFFFIQSPVLYAAMVREEFVPIQMRLSRVLFTTLFAAAGVILVSAVVRSSEIISPATLTAAGAFAAVAINKFVVFPMALRAGGESIRRGDATGETGTSVEFVAQGAGRSATRLHRVVVVFVLLMAGGLVAHAIMMAV
jgi:hypothetical protein